MQNQKVKNIITNAVLELLDKTMSDSKIVAITKKHEVKIHFVPIRYRIFGGLLQSLNIQFGNFIEVLMHQAERAFFIIWRLNITTITTLASLRIPIESLSKPTPAWLKV